MNKKQEQHLRERVPNEKTKAAMQAAAAAAVLAVMMLLR